MKPNSTVARLRQTAFSLVEVLVALGILAVIAVAVAQVTSSSYQGAAVSERRLSATLLAEGLMDEMLSRPYPSVATEASSAVEQAPAFARLLETAVQHSPELAGSFAAFLSPVRWEAAVLPAGNLKRIAVEVSWRETDQQRRFALSGVTSKR
jgi:prepilin-type N-terminal cleavage/methylation domain-containing protein